MSIWRTQFDLDIPAREEDGIPDEHGPHFVIDVATTWNPVIRFSVEGYDAPLAVNGQALEGYADCEMMITPDEARAIAAALNTAAAEHNPTP